MGLAELLAVGEDCELLACAPGVGDGEENVAAACVRSDLEVLLDALLEWRLVELLPVLDLGTDAGG